MRYRSFASTLIIAVGSASLLAACSASDTVPNRSSGKVSNGGTNNNGAPNGAGGSSSSGAGGSDPGGGWHPGTSDAGTTPPTMTGDEAGAPPPAADDAGSPTPPDPQFTTYSVTIGPINLSPGEETVVCITKKLDNPDAAFVPHMTAALAEGSHHLIAYRSNATQESLTPTPCQSFSGIIGGTAPIMISQRHEDELTFPSGVALKIAAHQMVTLEAHYINTTSAPLMGQGTFGVDTVPTTTENVIESDIAFWGTENINIPAHQSASTGVLFQSGIKGTHGFALTTHQHRMGTGFKIWFAKSASDMGKTILADTSNWQDPPLYQVDPQMVTFDGSNGLAYQCDWTNTTNGNLGFGESANNEMCFLWMYYYPSHGFDACGVFPCSPGIRQ